MVTVHWRLTKIFLEFQLKPKPAEQEDFARALTRNRSAHLKKKTILMEKKDSVKRGKPLEK
jgi:hypothetical protein